MRKNQPGRYARETRSKMRKRIAYLEAQLLIREVVISMQRAENGIQSAYMAQVKSHSNFTEGGIVVTPPEVPIGGELTIQVR